MNSDTGIGIVGHFAALDDPRIERTKEHLLMDIVTIAICAVICGADDWVEVAAVGRGKQEWFQHFLALPNGIPSHDTFWRVFRALDLLQFEECFLTWVREVMRLSEGEVVAIDGQMYCICRNLRPSYDRTSHKAAIHMVIAWATETDLVLGQREVNEKSKEIKALPELLRLLDIHGCIVTVDAIGCQKDVAETIRAQGADYLLAVKENQGKLYEDVKDLFAGAMAEHWRDVHHAYLRDVYGDHGRIEIRECWTISDGDFLDYLRNREAWKNLQTIVMLRCELTSPDPGGGDRSKIGDESSAYPRILGLIFE